MVERWDSIRRIALGSLVGLGACAPLEDEDGFDDIELRDFVLGGEVVTSTNSSRGGGGTIGGDWIINGLSETAVSGVNPAYALDSDSGLGSEGWLDDGDPDGEEVIQYMVECALPQGVSITVSNDDDDEYTFHGLLGLAPEWETGPCDQDCQQWVSACLLARTNEDGNEVEIFIQGDHPVLGYGTDWQFPGYEGVFFGNVFVEPEFKHACQGSGQGLFMAAMQGRTCALDSANCGFTIHDDCVVDAGCEMGSGDVPTIDCQPDPEGPAYHGISVHVGHGGGGGCGG